MQNFNFNVIEYLEDKNINYRTEGKNVSTGWVEIQCPFCSDISEHLGINLEGYGFNCWACGAKGHITKLIRTIEGTKNINDILKEYNTTIIKPKKYKNNTKFSLPKECFSVPDTIHKNYMQSRNFDIDRIIKKYNIKFCNMLSKNWTHRIIIPVYKDRDILTFTSRDTTRKAVSKYKHCSNNRSIVPIKKCIYNLDNCENYYVFVTEGVFDVWRMGDNTCALFGTEYTTEQIALLRRFKRVFILFDSTAYKNAVKLSGQLSGVVSNIKIIQLDKGDPAELTDKEVQEIKNIAK